MSGTDPRAGPDRYAPGRAISRGLTLIMSLAVAALAAAVALLPAFFPAGLGPWWAGLATFLLVAGPFFLLARVLTGRLIGDPIDRLCGCLKGLAEGETGRPPVESVPKWFRPAADCLDSLAGSLEARERDLAGARRRLEEETADRRRAEGEAAALARISRAVSVSENLEELFALIHASMEGILDTTNFFISFYDKEADVIAFPYWVDEKDERFDITQASRSGSLNAEVILTRRPLLLNSQQLSDRYDGEAFRQEWGSRSKSWLGVPLLVKGEVIGTCGVQSYTVSDLYTEQDVELFQSISHHIAVAIERKRAEEALRKSEELYRTLMQAAPDPILVYDLEGRVVFLNPAFTRIFGWTLAEVRGREVDYVPEEDRPKAQEALRLVLAGGPPLTLETKRFTKDGRLLDIQCSSSVYNGPKGKPVGVMVILRDVTEQRRLEEKIRAGEEQYRLVLEAAPDPVVVYDMVGRVTFLNPAFTQVFGWTLDELLGRKIDFVPEECWPETRRMIEMSQRGQRFTGVETRRYNKSRDVLDISISAAFWKDREGIPAGSVVQLRDITEKRKMEEDLRRTRNYLQNVVDSMPSVLIAVDERGRVTLWNHMARNLTGLDSREAEGRRLEDVFPLPGVKIEEVSECLRLREPRKIEKFLTLVDREPRYSDLVFYPLETDGVSGAVIRIDDVTARVRLEEIMVQTEKMMSVGGLAAGMAHEINNPLGGVIQGVQNVMRRLAPDHPANLTAARDCGLELETLHEYLVKRKILELLEGVLTSGRRAARIVSNMLDFSRRSAHEAKPVRLEQLLDQALDLAANDYDLKKQYDFRHIEIVREYETGLPEVYCDPIKIEQVILNLLRNAAQAMAGQREERAAPPRITLRARLLAAEVQIEIEDNGPGMDEKTRLRVFEPFFTTKERGMGTGLGLSVSYFIITDTHKGRMSLESSPGRGARFIIRLPLSPPGP
ncbi:MAG: PAS domain S-box protein [Thermodesulfobacteriota bacterium]